MNMIVVDPGSRDRDTGGKIASSVGAEGLRPVYVGAATTFARQPQREHYPQPRTGDWGYGWMADDGSTMKAGSG